MALHSARTQQVSAPLRHGGGRTPSTGLRVLCRLRPRIGGESSSGNVSVAAKDATSEIEVMRTPPGAPPGANRSVRSNFVFDQVMSPLKEQADVFASSLQAVIKDVVEGAEVAILAYGHTGAGKTYTIEGDLDFDSRFGLVPRAVQAVMQAMALGRYKDRRVRMTCLEIYNEELSDMLLPQGATPVRLELSENDYGVLAKGITEENVSTPREVVDLMRRVRERRRVGDQCTPGRSNYAHCVYTLLVYTRKAVDGGDLACLGKIHFADLAGSEKASGHGTPGAAAAARSHRALGRVIAASRSNARVPYLDSKLTHWLSDSLVKHQNVVILATVSPADADVDETLTTLSFCEHIIGGGSFGIGAEVSQGMPTPGDAGAGRPGLSRVAQSHAFVPPAPLPTFESTMEPAKTAASAAELAELRERNRHLNRELQDAQAAASRMNQENKHVNHRAVEIDARHEKVVAELEGLKKNFEAREVTAARCVDVANQKQTEAEVLGEAVREVRAQYANIQERCVTRGKTLVGARKQVRDLFADAAERLPRLAENISQPLAKAAAVAADEACDAHQQAQDALADVINQQEQAASDLVLAIRDVSTDLSFTVESVAADACDAVHARDHAAGEHFAAINAGLRCMMDTITNEHEELVQIVECGNSSIREQADQLKQDLMSCAQVHAGTSTNLSKRIHDACVAASASHSDAVRSSDNARELIFQLAKRLESSAAAAEDHRAYSINAASRMAALSDAAAERRNSFQEVLGKAAKEHAAAMNGAAPKQVADALEQMTRTLSARGKATVSQLDTVEKRLEKIRGAIADSSQHGEHAVRAVLSEADEALALAWRDGRDGLQRLAAGLQGDDEGAIANVLLAAVSTLDGARTSVLHQLESMRQHRALEHRIHSVLESQRQALRENIDEAQSNLQKANAELQAAQRELAGAQEQRERQREDFLAMIREVLVKMDEQHYNQVLVPALQACESAKAHVEAAIADAAAAEERALRCNGDVAHFVESWAAEEQASCDAVFEASDKAQFATEHIGGVVTGSVERLVAQVHALKETQDVASSRWTSARDGAVAATGEWAERGRETAKVLSQVLEEQQAAYQEVVALCDDVSLSQGRAEAAVEEVALADAKHARSLEDLKDLVVRDGAEEVAVESERAKAIGVLREYLHAAAPMAAECEAQANSLTQALHSHCTTLAAVPDSFMPTLADAQKAANGLAMEINFSMDSAAANVVRLRTTNAETMQALRQTAGDAEKAVSNSMGPIGVANQAERDAAIQAFEKDQLRWQDLVTKHKTVLGSLKVAAAKAGATVEAAVSSGRPLAKKRQGDADAAAARGRDAIDKLMKTYSDALSEQLAWFQEAVSSPPFAAFQREDADRTHEDAAPLEIPAAAEALLREGFKQMPAEAKLAGEFREKHARGPAAATKHYDDATPHVVKAFMSKVGADEAGGQSRFGRAAGTGGVLRELQAGALTAR